MGTAPDTQRILFLEWVSIFPFLHQVHSSFPCFSCKQIRRVCRHLVQISLTFIIDSVDMLIDMMIMKPLQARPLKLLLEVWSSAAPSDPLP